jgi:hypothetical protein
MSDGDSACFHVQLRQFPNSHTRFNLDAQELSAFAGPWARGEWVRAGERNWSSHQARLTIIEGPPLPVAQLSLGRGWRDAQRRGVDVTDRVLAAARSQPSVQSAPSGQATGAGQASSDVSPGDAVGVTAPAADSFALELLSLLEDGPVSLPRAWRLAADRSGGERASEALALAEHAVRSLLDRGLITLLEGIEAGERTIIGAEAHAALGDPSAWGAESRTESPHASPLSVRRS